MKWKRSRKGQADSKNKSQGSSKSKSDNETRKEPEALHKSQSASPLEAFEPQFPPSRLFINPKNHNDNNPYILGLA